MATYSKRSLRERSKGHWQARFCRTDRNGSSIVTKSLEASSRRAAAPIMEDIRRDLIEQEDNEASSSDFITYMRNYVDERENSRQIEASTATNYRSSIKHLARYLDGYSISEVSSENVMDVQAGLLAEGLVADTGAKDHRFLKQVMDYAAEMGHIKRSPFNKATKPPKRRKPHPNALTRRAERRSSPYLTLRRSRNRAWRPDWDCLPGFAAKKLPGFGGATWTSTPAGLRSEGPSAF